MYTVHVNGQFCADSGSYIRVHRRFFISISYTSQPAAKTLSVGSKSEQKHLEGWVQIIGKIMSKEGGGALCCKTLPA